MHIRLACQHSDPAITWLHYERQNKAIFRKIQGVKPLGREGTSELSAGRCAATTGYLIRPLRARGAGRWVGLAKSSLSPQSSFSFSRPRSSLPSTASDATPDAVLSCKGSSRFRVQKVPGLYRGFAPHPGPLPARPFSLRLTIRCGERGAVLARGAREVMGGFCARGVGGASRDVEGKRCVAPHFRAAARPGVWRLEPGVVSSGGLPGAELVCSGRQPRPRGQSLRRAGSDKVRPLSAGRCAATTGYLIRLLRGGGAGRWVGLAKSSLSPKSSFSFSRPRSSLPSTASDATPDAVLSCKGSSRFRVEKVPGLYRGFAPHPGPLPARPFSLRLAIRCGERGAVLARGAREVMGGFCARGVGGASRDVEGKRCVAPHFRAAARPGVWRLETGLSPVGDCREPNLSAPAGNLRRGGNRSGGPDQTKSAH